MTDSNPASLLDVKNLSVSFSTKGEHGFAARSASRIRAVDSVSFTLEKGTVTGIVGESGCGKTTLARTIARFQKADGGTVFVNGTDLLRLSGRKLRKFRRRIQMVFQNPFASLDPRMTIFGIINEAIAAAPKRNAAERRRLVATYLEMTGLDPSLMYKFPYEFSGGQRQRIAIARALAAEPSIIVADEPVSSLDVSVAAQILNLFSSLRKRLDLSMLFISHDLAVVRFISQNIIIMYRGRIVESGTTEAIFKQPLHPYTLNLLQSVPDIVESSVTPFFEAASLKELAGSLSQGCAYAARCDIVREECRTEIPPLQCSEDQGSKHYCACFCADRALAAR
jgi:oligopeptide transport system ATP-binding protein